MSFKDLIFMLFNWTVTFFIALLAIGLSLYFTVEVLDLNFLGGISNLTSPTVTMIVLGIGSLYVWHAFACHGKRLLGYKTNLDN